MPSARASVRLFCVSSASPRSLLQNHQIPQYPNTGAAFDANQDTTGTFMALLKAAAIDPTNLKGTIIVPDNKVGQHGATQAAALSMHAVGSVVYTHPPLGQLHELACALHCMPRPTFSSLPQRHNDSHLPAC